jgi:hypothetical protein
MERVCEAVKDLDPQEAYLVSDRTVEMLLRDRRLVRITARKNLKSSSEFSADHEMAVVVEQDGQSVTLWGHIDLPWATADTVEECLAQAIRLMKRP